ncbi:MAG: DUF4405 domain-containing protein [Thermoguttaceae bacterium]
MSRFNTRGFVSLLLSLSFFVAVVSGLVLWLTHSPQTLGLGRGDWKHIHIFVALLMMIAGIWHFILNWAVYASYLWRANRPNLKWEAALAVVVTAAVTCTTLLEEHGSSARLMAATLQQIAGNSGQSVEKLVAALRDDGIQVHNPADSLREIAEHNKLSAEKVCAAVERHAGGGPRSSEGRGPSR